MKIPILAVFVILTITTEYLVECFNDTCDYASYIFVWKTGPVNSVNVVVRI